MPLTVASHRERGQHAAAERSIMSTLIEPRKTGPRTACVCDGVPTTVAAPCASGSRSSVCAGARLLRRRLDRAVGSAESPTLDGRSDRECGGSHHVAQNCNQAIRCLCQRLSGNAASRRRQAGGHTNGETVAAPASTDGRGRDSISATELVRALTVIETSLGRTQR